jgi:hypothetical protein
MLEAEVNRIASEEPLMKLKQVLMIPGAGFVAVVERDDYETAAPAEPVEPARPKPAPVKPREEERKQAARGRS